MMPGRISVQTDREMKNLVAVVRLAISPFEPGDVLAFVNENRTVQVVVSNMPSCRFSTSLDSIEMGRAASVLEVIYEKVFQYFRHRPSLPVDDHIILGEE